MAKEEPGSEEFRKWYASLPEERQWEIAEEVSITSGFQEAAAKISWDKEAVQRLSDNLRYIK